MAEEVGGIVYEVGMEVQGLKAGAAAVESELSKVDSAANSTNKSLDKLDNQASVTGKAFASLVSIVKNIDATLTKMSASSGQAGSAVQQASQSAEQANQVIAALNTQISLMQQQQTAAAQSSASLETSLNATTAAIRQMAQQTSASSQQISGADRMIEQLGNQVAILDEQMENGARSAAIFAAQLRAGDGATDAQKAKIAELTGRLYDMKNGTEAATKSGTGFKSIMQQSGYQIQDFIVQVQGGQSALVAFSQQGSQLAGAFGPTGAIVGALIALGSVITGVLITSLNGGKNAIDALKDAADAMDKVVTVSANGVAALSDKWAALARTNAEVATLMRNQALLEYNQAIAKIPKAITDAADSFVTLGDKALAAIGGASPSIKKFNDELAALKITTDNWSEAISQVASNGQYASGITNSLSATVNTLANRLGIGQQQAFELAKQLSDLSKNPSPQALQDLAVSLQKMTSSSTEGQTAITALAGQVIVLAREAANAKVNSDALTASIDNLTAGQKGLIQQSERNLALSKLEGAARAKLAAQYAAVDAGLGKDDPITKTLMDRAAATYNNTEATKKLKKENDSAAKMAESNAQKLDKLREQSDLTTESIEKRRIEEAGLRAAQSLNSAATQSQIDEARAIGEANERAAISIQKRKEAEQGQKFAKQEIASSQANNIDPNTGLVADPMAQVNLQEQQKLDALAKYQELDKQNTALYEQAKTAIQADAARQRKEIADDEQRQQQQNMSMLLGSTSNFFGEMAGAIGDYAGESSAAYKTLFAISKGFAIAQASMNLVTAISNATALPWPANIPAIAFAVAQGANLISQIRGASYSGGRKNGGPVLGSSMYQVGENGLPEIFQASNGNQYMIPGDNGRVISNRDLSSGSSSSGVVVYNNITNNSSASVSSTSTRNNDGSVTIDTLITDLNEGGPLSQAITANTTASRRATE